MSDEKANNKTAMLRENEQRAAKMLCELADVLPDAVTDSWMQTAGFSALSGTKHGQKLVREVMRATLTHVAAPIVAEQWMIKAELENQRDARTAPPESQVRPARASLPDVVPFFDDQLDVQALLAEVAQAHEQDRPCFGGQPQMIDRLAHIIRTYRGMETRDGAQRIGVAPIGKSTTHAEEVAEARRILLGAGTPDKPLVDQVKHVASDVRELSGIRSIVHPGDGDVTSLVVRSMHAAHEKMREQLVRIRQILARSGADPLPDDMADAAGEFLEGIESELDKLDWPNDGTLVERIRSIQRIIDSKDAALTAFWQDIRTIVGPVDVTDADREAVTEEDAANGPDAREYYAERKALLRVVRERAEVCGTIRFIGTTLPKIELTDYDRGGVSEAEYAKNRRGYDAKLRAIVRVLEDKCCENKSIYNELHRAGFLSSNKPSHNEYKALDAVRSVLSELADIHQILTSAGFALANGLVASVRTLAERNGRDVADKLNRLEHVSKVRDQFELELSEIRDVLSKAGHTVNTHEQLMGVLLALAGEDAPLNDGESVETISGVWHSKFSNSYNRKLVELLSAYAYAGDADVRDVMNALPMPHVRARITALIHAIETLAIAHRMNVADHLR